LAVACVLRLLDFCNLKSGFSDNHGFAFPGVAGFLPEAEVLQFTVYSWQLFQLTVLQFTGF
jgi:hypothetical protein